MYKCGALTLMDDGYCVRCGCKHTGKDLVRATKPVSVPERKAVKVEIKPDPVVFPKFDLGFDKPKVQTKENKYSVKAVKTLVKETLDLLVDKYGIPYTTVKFTRGRGAKHLYHLVHKKHRYVFGTTLLRYVYTQGYKEYQTLQYLMRGKRPKYNEAIKFVVAHEYAHALQCEAGGRVPGSVHNRVFVQKYKEVMDFLGIAP